jgi:hypothetical protein
MRGLETAIAAGVVALEIRLRHGQSRAARLGSALAYLVGIQQLPSRDQPETLSIRPLTPTCQERLRAANWTKRSATAV